MCVTEGQYCGVGKAHVLIILDSVCVLISQWNNPYHLLLMITRIDRYDV